jgi:hypothetical protein
MIGDGLAIQSIIGLLILIIMLITLMMLYVIIYNYDLFFIPSIVGVIIILIISLHSIVSETNYIKKAFKNYEEDTDFDKCPEYWSTVINNNREITCYNMNGSLVIGEKVDVLEGNAVTNEGDVIESKVIRINDMNLMTNIDKCREAKKLAWTQGHNKCTNFQ